MFSKDGITVAAILDDRREKKGGVYPVKIRVTYNRIRKYYPTGKALTHETWIKLPETKTRRLIDIRESIENSFSIIKDVVDEIASNGHFSFGELNLRLGRGNTGNLNTAFQAKIERLNDEGRIGNRNMYVTVSKGVERFAGNNISFDSVTPDWLGRYDKFLLAEGKRRATISMHFRTIRAIINEAKRSGIIKESSYPFGKGKFEIQEGDGGKIPLTIQQIGQIVKYEPESEITARYRDYWLFLYFCNGINVADFIRLKYRNIVNGEVCFIRQKTQHTVKKQKEIRAVIIPQMQEIIDRWGNPPRPDNYIFPVLDHRDKSDEKIFIKKNNFNREINKRMKAVGEALGIPGISTYTARHSYATVLKRSGANIAYISETLGHNELKTTEAYLAAFEKEERLKNAAFLVQFD